MVIFSLFAPSVLHLIVEESELITVIDTTEEENKKENKKENNKELEEKDVFMQDLENFESIYNGIQFAKASNYLDGSCQHHSEIFLPPPEQRS